MAVSFGKFNVFMTRTALKTQDALTPVRRRMIGLHLRDLESDTVRIRGKLQDAAPRAGEQCRVGSLEEKRRDLADQFDRIRTTADLMRQTANVHHLGGLDLAIDNLAVLHSKGQDGRHDARVQSALLHVAKLRSHARTTVLRELSYRHDAAAAFDTAKLNAKRYEKLQHGVGKLHEEIGTASPEFRQLSEEAHARIEGLSDTLVRARDAADAHGTVKHIARHIARIGTGDELQTMLTRRAKLGESFFPTKSDGSPAPRLRRLDDKYVRPAIDAVISSTEKDIERTRSRYGLGRFDAPASQNPFSAEVPRAATPGIFNAATKNIRILREVAARDDAAAVFPKARGRLAVLDDKYGKLLKTVDDTSADATPAPAGHRASIWSKLLKRRPARASSAPPLAATTSLRRPAEPPRNPAPSDAAMHVASSEHSHRSIPASRPEHSRHSAESMRSRRSTESMHSRHSADSTHSRRSANSKHSQRAEPAERSRRDD